MVPQLIVGACLAGLSYIDTARPVMKISPGYIAPDYKPEAHTYTPVEREETSGGIGTLRGAWPSDEQIPRCDGAVHVAVAKCTATGG